VKLAALGLVVSVLAACGSQTPAAPGASSGSASGSTSAAPSGAVCTESSIESAIPANTDLDRWGCAKFTSGYPATTRIAAADVTKEDDSHEVLWFQATEQSGGTFTNWATADGKDLCANAPLSDGLKPFCDGSQPTSSPTATASPTSSPTNAPPPDSLCDKAVVQKYLREEVDNGEKLTVSQVTCQRFAVNGTELLGAGVVANDGTKDSSYVVVADNDGDAPPPDNWYWMIKACPLPASFPEELVMFCEQPA